MTTAARVLPLVVCALGACQSRGRELTPQRPPSRQQAQAAGEPVWPGTSTRYYPGIYPRFRLSDFDPTGIQDEWERWFAGREDTYREFVGAVPVTHLGIDLNIDPGYFFTSAWRDATTPPYDWAGTCARIAAAQDPAAAPGGEPLYDWAFWDALLGQPFLAEGRGKLVVRVMETYAYGSRTPQWMHDEGYARPGASDSWSYTQMQDWAVVRMWQDVMTAFARRYENDPRLAAMLFDETYPSLWQQQDLCGHVHGLSDPAQAANAGLMEVMNAYLDVDPGMLWAIVNWFPAQEPVIETWEQGFDLGGGERTLGANDLPGVQGHYRQDPKFFGNEGSGASCSFDATGGVYFNNLLAQHYAISRTAPVFVGDEANGWYLQSSSDHRNGAANPWGVDPWPDWEPAGSLPNDDGDQFPSTRFWLWYTSGPPRAADAAARDSGLGQAGEDPCGVVPANFYSMAAANYAPANRPAWNPTNLSINKWLRAFDTFGPSGTKAMFHHPPGYLEQFTIERPSYVIGRLATPPVIDGDLNEYEGLPAIEVDAGGAHVTYRLGWDDDALYLAARVTDPAVEAPITDEDGELWENDSIEVLFDTAADRQGWNDDDYKFFVSARGVTHDQRGPFSPGVTWDPAAGSFSSAVVLTPSTTLDDGGDVDTGYVVEVRIAFTGWSMAAPQPGAHWGLELALNDRAGGLRTQGAWSRLTGDTNDHAGFGTATFAADGTVDGAANPDGGAPDGAGPAGDPQGGDPRSPGGGDVLQLEVTVRGCDCRSAGPGAWLALTLLVVKRRRAPRASRVPG